MRYGVENEGLGAWIEGPWHRCGYGAIKLHGDGRSILTQVNASDRSCEIAAAASVVAVIAARVQQCLYPVIAGRHVRKRTGPRRIVGVHANGFVLGQIVDVACGNRHVIRWRERFDIDRVRWDRGGRVHALGEHDQPP